MSSNHFRSHLRRGWLLLLVVLGLLSGVVSAQLDEVQRQYATVERVNMSTALNQSANGQFPTLNENGRYVLFWTDDSKLIPNDFNSTGDIYLRDRQINETVRVSIGNGNVEANNLTFAENDISDNGTLIVYASNATNLIGGDTNGFTDIFVFDRGLGAVARASITFNEIQTNGPSYKPVISGDGRFVAFRSQASNIVANRSSTQPDIFLFDRAGQPGARMAQINVHSNGTPANQEDNNGRIAINSNGNFIAFDSIATNLVGNDTNGRRDIFLRDRTTNKTTRISLGLNGAQANGHSSHPAISATGRYIAFRSEANNLVEGDTNNFADIFVYDREEDTITRVNVSREGEQANSNAEMPGITSNGRFVSFQSTAKNMVAGDVNNTADIFVHDRNTGVTTVVSIAGNGAQANGFNAPIHSISGDGGFIAFESVANNLVQNDTNNSNDIFVARGGPNSPTNLTVSDITSTSLKLTWDDNANNETGYEVERRRGTGLFQVVGKLKANIETFNQTNLRPCTQYTYWVFAVNAVARSGSEIVTAKTLGCPPGAFKLTSPLHNRTIVNVDSLTRFRWTASVEATTYELRLENTDTNDVLIDETLNTADICGGLQCIYEVDNTLKSQLVNGSYQWEVTAVNNVGETEASNNPFRFDVDDTLPPRDFALLTPEYGALLRSGEAAATITWDNNPDAADYDFALLKISNNPDEVKLGTIINVGALTPEADADNLLCDEGVCSFSLTSGQQTSLDTGLYSWTVIARSPGGETTESSSAAMLFRINEGDINLLRNSGFEDYDATTKLPTDWKGQKLTGDTVICNKTFNNPSKPPKIFAHSGDCAFRFTGGANESAKLLQDVDGSLLIEDDQLRFSGFVSGKQLVGTVTAIMRVTYVDQVNQPETVKFTAAAGGYAYDDFSQTLTIDGPVKLVKVILQSKAKSGAILVDTLRVEIVQTGVLTNVTGVPVPNPISDGGLIPVPAAPADLRGQS